MMKKTSARHVILAVFTMTLFLATAHLPADTIVLKRGEQREGVIVREDSETVTLQYGSSLVQIPRSQISEIIRSEANSEEERLGDRLARQGDWRGALEQYEKANALAPDGERLAGKIENARARVMQAEQEQANSLLKGVTNAEAAMRYDVAIQRLKALLARTPEGPFHDQLVRRLAENHYRNAKVEADAVRFDEAKRQLRQAIATDPDFRLAYLELAEMLRSDPAQASEADNLFAQGFALPEPAIPPEAECRYRYHWAELQYRAQEYQKALDNFNRVVKECPRDFPFLMNYIVDVNIRLGEKLKGDDIDQSIVALQSAIERDESALDARFLLAQIYYDNGRYDEAIAALEGLLDFDATFPRANYLLAHSYMEEGDTENYRRYLEREIQVNSASYDSYCELGEHLLDGAKNQEALARFEQAIRVNEVPGRAHFGRARALIKLKRLEEAEQEARTIVEKDPNNPEGLTALGEVLAAQGRLSEADTQLLRAVSLYSEKEELNEREKRILAETYYRIGEVALKAKSSNKAYENFLKSVQLNPQNPAAYHGMATALVDAGRLPEAEDAYISAIQQKPDEPEYYLGLGILYHTHYEQPREALPFYLKYLELGGEDIANVERWIEQCGGRPGDQANINVDGLAERVRQRRAAQALAAAQQEASSATLALDGATTGTLALDGLTTGTLAADGAPVETAGGEESPNL